MIENEPTTPRSSSFKASKGASDEFDDEALKDLFAPLLAD